MRLDPVVAALAALTLTSVINTVDAQESSARRTGIEAGVGVGTSVPGRGEDGLGPFVSATLRLASGGSGRAFLLGVGYGIVFTEGWTSHDGLFRSEFAPEAVMLHFGHEWPLGAPRRFAIDAQWNPALVRTRRFGTQPPWVSGPSPWEWTAATASLGLRYTLSGSRGAVVAVNLRNYLNLTQYIWLGGVHPWHVVGISVRPR
jgi:hypothetical protein